MAVARTFAELRARMVTKQLAEQGISDPRVLQAMREIPRHEFVPLSRRLAAYDNRALRIGEGQTISQPFIVGLMTQLLDLKGEEKVLEVGTGSGYQAAILSKLAREVHTIEQYPRLAERARQTLERMGITNVRVYVADGSSGLPREAPFGGILVAAAAPKAPHPLLEQLADGAYLVVPVGDVRGQSLQQWQRKGEEFVSRNIGAVAFVPLRGEMGWHGDDWVKSVKQ